MCIICIEYSKGKLTEDEALRNISEMILTSEDLDDEQIDHLLDVEDQLLNNQGE